MSVVSERILAFGLGSFGVVGTHGPCLASQASVRVSNEATAHESTPLPADLSIVELTNRTGGLAIDDPAGTLVRSATDFVSAHGYLPLDPTHDAVMDELLAAARSSDGSEPL